MIERSPVSSSPAEPVRLRECTDYLRLLAARLSGTAANQMLMVALGWQMYDLTGSAWDLGLVGLVQFVPALVFTLPAGQLVDRHDRRLLLALSVSTQAAVAGALALASWQSWVDAALILSLSVGLGLARALQMPALQALTPTLVPRALLQRAVAGNSSVMQSAVVAGPALGGVIYAAGSAGPGGVGAAFGAVSVYGLSFALLALATGAVLAIRHRAAAGAPRAQGWEGVADGLRFILHRPVLLGAVSLDLFAVLLGGATALLPIFARDILNTGPQGLGLLRAAPAFGAVLVGLWLARHPIQRRVGVWLLASVAVFGLATLGFGLSTTLPLAVLMLAVTGAADMVSVVLRQSLVQLETPDDMRGRVAAVNSVFIGASNQLGEFESGATAAWLGPVGSVLLGGVGTLLVVAAWWRLFPALAQRDAMHTPH